MQNNIKYNGIIENIKINVNNRKILIWGAWKKGKELLEILISNGIDIEGFIDSNETKTKYEKYKVYHKKDIFDSTKYYIVLSIVYHLDVKDFLEMVGYRNIRDYYWVDSRQITITNCFMDFLDSFDNKISGAGVDNFKVQFIGKGSDFKIGHNCTISPSVEIILSENSKIIVGDNCIIADNTRIIVSCESTLIIGNNCRIGAESKLTVSEKSSIVIGDNVRIGNYFTIISKFKGVASIGNKILFSEYSFLVITKCNLNIDNECTFGQKFDLRAELGDIIIGKDCQISYNVIIRSSDGHSIYDLENNKVISTNETSSVKIGCHVWIGVRSTILYNTQIGDNSIIGANSFVKGKILGNCIAAGYPAKVIKENIIWDRDPCMLDDDLHNKYYL